LAHLIKPLLETEETSKILTASMSTIHAATNTQNVLDAVPKASASDLRKNRSVLNNIILSTTGSAKALEQFCPRSSRSASWRIRCGSRPVRFTDYAERDIPYPA